MCFFLDIVNTYDIINKYLMEKLLLLGSSNGEEDKMDTDISQPSDMMDTSEQLDNTQSPDRSLTGKSQDCNNNNSTSSSINEMLSYLTKCYEKANKEEKIMIKVLCLNLLQQTWFVFERIYGIE